MAPTLFLLLALLTPHAHAFDPGCSFVSGQCQYNVKLGHQASCDTPSPDSCCQNVNALETSLADLQRQMRTLQEKVQDLTIHGGQVTSSPQDHVTSPPQGHVTSSPQGHVTSSPQGQDWNYYGFAALEAELNSTKQQLAALKASSSREIESLRSDLSNATRELHTCRLAVGMQGVDVPESQYNDISMTYCGFNNGSSDMCGFTHLTSSDKFSLMTHGSSSTTGPKVDHSVGSLADGQYLGLDSKAIASRHLYYSTSSSNRPTFTAQLESPWFPPARSYCVMFWYNMDGDDVRDLKVTVRTGGGTGYPVFTKSGDQGNRWHLGQVDLDHEYTHSDFKIDFIGTTGAYSYKYSHSSSSSSLRYDDADIAIDDVYVYNSTCSAVLQCPSSSLRFTHPKTNVTSCYTIHAHPRTHAEAADVCRREGPHSSLLRVDDEEEQNWLSQTLRGDRALLAVGVSGFHTSGTDQYSEHSFRWTDQGTLDPMLYDNWHLHQPNNVGGHQDCLLLMYAEDNFSWGDEDCYGDHPFICEGHYD